MEKSVLFLSVVVIFVQAVSLPPEIVTCKKSDPNYKSCLLKALKDSIKFLAKGNKDLGVSPIDPMYFPKIHIAGNGGSVDIDHTYIDMYLHGYANSEFTDVKIDIEGSNCNIHLEKLTPHLELIGQFVVKGKLLLFTLAGHGPANITAINAKSKIDLTCKKVEKNGETYLEITDTRIDMTPEKCIYDIKNLVDGNEALSANILNVMNENDREIYSELKADYAKVINTAVQAVAGAFFKKVPVGSVFLP